MAKEEASRVATYLHMVSGIASTSRTPDTHPLQRQIRKDQKNRGIPRQLGARTLPTFCKRRFQSDCPGVSLLQYGGNLGSGTSVLLYPAL